MTDFVLLDDQALVEQTRRGAKGAFDVLWQRYYASAFNYAKMLSDERRCDAEDLVVEAYTRVWRTIRNGSGPTSNFRAYLYKTVRSAAADRGPRCEYPVDQVDVSGHFEVAPGPELDNVAKCFYTLNERYRRVLWLSAVEGRKPAEIGQLLGLDARHVSVLALRARDAFRKRFAQLD